MSLLAYTIAVYSAGIPNYPVPKAVNSMFTMVVYASNDMDLVHPAVVYTRTISLLAYRTTTNFYTVSNFSVPKAVSSMYSMVVHSRVGRFLTDMVKTYFLNCHVSAPDSSTFYSALKGPYPRYCEVIHFKEIFPAVTF